MNLGDTVDIVPKRRYTGKRNSGVERICRRAARRRQSIVFEYAKAMLSIHRFNKFKRRVLLDRVVTGKFNLHSTQDN